MGGRAAQALLDPHRHLPSGKFGSAAIDDDALFAVRKFKCQGGSAAVACMPRPRRRRGIEHQHSPARIGALIAPVPAVLDRARAHAAGPDQCIDLLARSCTCALPATQCAIAHPQRQQGGHQQAKHRFECRRCVAVDSFVTGPQVNQQRDRFHLRQWAARQHAAVLAHQFPQRAQQARFAEQAARAAIGQQQPGGNDGAPACDLPQSIFRTGHFAVEEARGRLHRFERARTQTGLARQDQRRPDQPCHQPQTGMLDRPCRAFGGHRIGFQPAGEQVLPDRGAIFPRSAGAKVAQPGKSLHRALDGRGKLGVAGEIDLADRNLQPMNQELSGPQRHTRCAVALKRADDRRQQARRRRLAQRCGQNGTGHAQAIGPAHHAIHRAGAGRLEVCQNKGPRGFERDRLGPFGHRLFHQGFVHIG